VKSRYSHEVGATNGGHTWEAVLDILVRKAHYRREIGPRTLCAFVGRRLMYDNIHVGCASLLGPVDL